MVEAQPDDELARHCSFERRLCFLFGHILLQDSFSLELLVYTLLPLFSKVSSMIYISVQFVERAKKVGLEIQSLIYTLHRIFQYMSMYLQWKD